MIDATDLVNKVNNVVKYGTGYLTAIGEEKLSFNRKLAAVVVGMLYGYVDSQSEITPRRLHHVYEPGMVGNPSGRLFEITTAVTLEGIKLASRFKKSKIPSLSGSEPFVNKAEVMEAGEPVTISPRNGGVLAFEVNGEQVFTSVDVVVEHPGGPAVAQAFVQTVENFINSYLIASVIDPVMRGLANHMDFDNSFADGAKYGYMTGIAAGRRHMSRSINELG